MATITATDASYNAVLAAVNSSSNGDTVNVPSGSATWPLTLNLGGKAIQLKGSNGSTLNDSNRGSDATTIITNSANTSGGIRGNAIRSSNAGGNLVRISGFRFNSVDRQGPVIAVVGPASKLRVDHCYFNKGDAALGTNLNNFPGTGPVYGVTDHCTCVNMDRPYFCMDVRVGDGPWGRIAWTEPTLPGTDQIMVMEDNLFTWDSNNTDTNAQFAVYGSYGGSVCFRKNTCTGWPDYINAHPGGQDYSNKLYEIYDNVFTEGFLNPGASGGCIMSQQGGMWIVHDNDFNGNLNAGGVFVTELPHEMLAPYGATDHYMPSHTYIWNNRKNGVLQNITGVHDYGVQPPGTGNTLMPFNVAYFFNPPQSGQTFYPYNELAYPHPLVSSGPNISVSPSSINSGITIANVPTFTSPSVTNSGNAQLTGSVSTSTPWIIPSEASYNLAPGASQDISVEFLPTVKGNYLGSLVFTGGGGATIPISGIAAPLLPSLTFAADDGVVVAPFTVDGSHHVSQPDGTALPAGGIAAYGFTIATAGDYKIVVNVDAEDSESNSFYVAVDAQPVGNADIWDIVKFTAGFEDRTIGLRGDGSGPGGQQFPEKIWTLSAGDHLLIIKGREAGATLGQITVTPADAVVLPDVPSNPHPMDGETDLVVTTPLTWDAVPNATTYDIAFGTVNPPPQAVSGYEVAIYVPTLRYSTQYYWRVTARNAAGSTAGPVWSFVTGDSTAVISSPSPANGATGVSITPILRWNGEGDTYDIAFEDANPPTVVYTGQLSNAFDVATVSGSHLDFNTTYYWSVLSHADAGDTQGPTWSFTTASDSAVVPKIIFVG